MRFAFIEEHRAQWSVQVQCEVLEVLRSGFYAWRGREPSRAELRREALTETIREVHQASRATYGSCMQNCVREASDAIERL
jgi:putative transposase